MNFRDLLTFEKFLTPLLVKFVYWIGLAGILIGFIIGFMDTFSANGGGFLEAIAALVIAIISTIFWRVFCEGIILAFQSYDRLKEIRDRLPRG